VGGKGITLLQVRFRDGVSLFLGVSTEHRLWNWEPCESKVCFEFVDLEGLILRMKILLELAIMDIERHIPHVSE